MLEGSYISGGKESRIREGRMKGDIISLTINDRIYTGRVQGNRIEGNIADSSGNSLREWTATR
jgi:hypothetical protein